MILSLGSATLAILAALCVLTVTIACYLFGMSKDTAYSAILSSCFTASVMLVLYIVLERLYVLIMSW
jgi:hypothetical protein